jgi:hypothetical protein
MFSSISVFLDPPPNSRLPLISHLNFSEFQRFAWRELYGGSGFREKTLRWEIATGSCRSREIGDTPWEGMREFLRMERMGRAT